MSYLLPYVFGDRQVEDLKIWLKGHITRPDYLTNPPPSLDQLHEALNIGCKEIIRVLDPTLEAVIHACADSETEILIEVEENDFWTSRMVDYEGFLDDEKIMRKMDREDLMRFLVEARDEIEWMVNEIRRLQMHIENARKSRREGHRITFSYTVSKRKHGDVVSAPSEVADAAAAEIKDEEMVDDDEFVDARETRSASPPPELTNPFRADQSGRQRVLEDRRKRSATPEPSDMDVDVEEREIKAEDERRDSGGR